MFYEDNNPFTMGNMTFTFRICPGHCPGACAYFFEDTDEETGKTYKVAMHGGIGETSSERVLKSGAPLWHYYRFLADCLEMSEWPIDIVLASHENQFNLFSGVNYDDPRDYSAFTHGDIWKLLVMSKYEDAKRMG